MPPTRMEIADYFGIHTNAAHERLNALADKGFIELIPAIARGIKLLCICPRKPCPFHQLEIATSA